MEKSIRNLTCEKPTKITRIDITHLRCDSINASKVNGFRQPISHDFTFDETFNHKQFTGFDLKTL